MRHRVAHRKLGRVTEHRIAMLRNQATALLRYEHLTTTVPRAKELRPFVEKLITKARSGTLHDRRQAVRHVHKRETADKLFQDLGKRFATRRGGYTRILKTGHRKGDGAEMARIELVGGEG